MPGSPRTIPQSSPADGLGKVGISNDVSADDTLASCLGRRPRPGRSGARHGVARVRLDNAVTVFLNEWPSEGVSKDTIRSYRTALGWLCAFANQHKQPMLSDLTPSLLRAAMVEKMDESHAHRANWKGGESAAAHMAFAARALARWALAQGMRVDDLSSVKAPRVPERVQPRLFDDERQAIETTILRRLLDGTRRTPRVAIARDLALLNFLAETGLRAQEVCQMELRDVDLGRGYVTVRRGKGKKERMLPIIGPPDDHDPERVLRLVSDWIDTRTGLKGAKLHDRLWTSTRGHPIESDELRRILARMCIEAGLSETRPPHAFRRYVFTEHYRQRPSAIKRLSARMGWSEKSTNMVNTYTRGAELDFARDPLPLLGGRDWAESTIPRTVARPMLTLGVGSVAGKGERPGPDLPVRDRQVPGRLPNPRTGRHP